jgi:deoxyribodipyrimidine photo-lyase
MNKRNPEPVESITPAKKPKPLYNKSHDGTKNYIIYKDENSVIEYTPGWKLEKNFDDHTTVVYFKFDLRTLDNPALFNGCKYAKENTNGRLIGLYVLCVKELKVHEYADCKILLIHDTLINMQRDLKYKYDITLVIIIEPEPTMVPYAVREFCTQVKCKALFNNQMYEHDEAKRDSIMENLCKANYIQCTSFEDQCVVPVQTLKTGKGNDFGVFTPYKKAWLAAIEANSPKYLKIFDLKDLNYRNQSDLNIEVTNEISLEESVKPLDRAAFEYGKWSKTESEIIAMADHFIKFKGDNYKKSRDFPGIAGTSQLSPYLATGSISAKYLIVKAKEANNKKLSSGSEGIMTYINELCWRDFYRNILVAFPHVSKNRPFKRDTEKLEWNESQENFDRWCNGKTGFPIVDAAMNQMNTTGWMHNRLRMITAMFLTKDLLINWRMGESYFMSKLIDGDLAANNGGWQWSASTGTDSQPYFRIFNPLLQSQKFDADGAFIRKWIPELANIKDKKIIHEPSKHLSAKEFEKLSYPKPICDHAASRVKAIAAFKKLSMRA